MKIAINCAFFQPKGGGIKEYIQNLVENLSIVDSENEYVLYVLEDQLDYAKKNLKTHFRIKDIPYKSNGLANVMQRSLFEDFFWRQEELTENWDIFHSPFFHGPKLRHTPLLLTVHDMRFYRFPKTYTFLRYQFLKRAVKNSIERAFHIISISDFTKNEICYAYKTNPSKITTIHEAINRDHFSSMPLSENDNHLISDLLGKKFILTVGHMEPRKNYNRLIKAFEKVKSDDGLKLVIVGKKAHDYTETLHQIDTNPDIIYMDFVSDALLNWLYREANVFVFPSFYEGFGFPPLEAASHGTISAVSKISSMPEVCGDSVLYFDPYNIDDIANKITQLLDDETLQASLSSKLENQLAKFSWRQNAEDTLNVYNFIKEQSTVCMMGGEGNTLIIINISYLCDYIKICKNPICA